MMRVLSRKDSVLVLATGSMVVWYTVAALLTLLHEAEGAVQAVALLAPGQEMFPSLQLQPITSNHPNIINHLSTSSSHRRPVHVRGHEQEKSPSRSMQCPSLRQGSSAHSSTFNGL